MKVVVAGLIYKSTAYLDFMLRWMRERFDDARDFELEYLIVGNDPTPEVAARLKNDFEDAWLDGTGKWDPGKHLTRIKYFDRRFHDHYLTRVYRAWNVAGHYATTKLLADI